MPNTQRKVQTNQIPTQHKVLKNHFKKTITKMIKNRIKKMPTLEQIKQGQHHLYSRKNMKFMRNVYVSWITLRYHRNQIRLSHDFRKQFNVLKNGPLKKSLFESTVGQKAVQFYLVLCQKHLAYNRNWMKSSMIWRNPVSSIPKPTTFKEKLIEGAKDIKWAASQLTFKVSKPRKNLHQAQIEMNFHSIDNQDPMQPGKKVTVHQLANLSANKTVFKPWK